MNEITRVATNGSWVTITMKTSAGSSGARLAHAAARSDGRGEGAAALRTPGGRILSIEVLLTRSLHSGRWPRPRAPRGREYRVESNRSLLLVLGGDLFRERLALGEGRGHRSAA